MVKRKKFVSIFCVTILIVVGAFLLVAATKKDKVDVTDREVRQVPSSSVSPAFEQKTNMPTPSLKTMSPNSSVGKEVVERNVLMEVPFIVQAPRHNWGDLLYQNACEEAAILMAMRWVQQRPLTNDEAYTEIKKISDYSQEKYGFYLDQSAEDTARLMRDYFNYKNVDYVDKIGISDIKEELMKGNLVLVPVNGRKLGNPFFTAPGPIEHMLVIKGYDVEKKEFITNDSGIGRGNGYRYKEEVLQNALQRYPTGYHGAIDKIEKVMIVVSR